MLEQFSICGNGTPSAYSSIYSVSKPVNKDYSRISLGFASIAILFAIIFTAYPIESAQGQITTVPNAPTGLTATAVSSSQVNLSWIAPTNNGGSPLTGYKIETKVGAGSWSTLAANAGTITTYSNTGLTPSTDYTYRVSAINSVGPSVPSTQVLATTQPIQSSVTQNNGLDSSLTTGWQNYVSLVKFTNLTPGSQIDAVAIKISNPSGNIRYKVYQDNGAGGNPSTLLAQTNSIPAQAGIVYNSLNSPAIVPSS